jgi:metal-sulfur cluster biosynthetic enzyme
MGPISEAAVREALGRVEDPELGIDVVNLGLVYDVALDGPRVTVQMTLTTIGCPAAGEIEAQTRAAIGAVAGVEQVVVDWTFDPPWTPELLTEEGRDLLLALGYL